MMSKVKKYMPILAVPLLFEIAGIAFGETVEPNIIDSGTKFESGIKCKEDGTPAEMGQCALEKFWKDDAEMKDIYNKKISLLHGQTSKERLQDAEKAWIIFRNKSCFYEVGSYWGSGSGWGSAQYSCLEHYTELRIEDLKRYTDCTQNGCPE